MQKLQELLDKKFPIYDVMPFHERKKANLKREAFQDGYNAAIKEIGSFGQKKANEGDTIFILLTKFVNKD